MTRRTPIDVEQAVAAAYVACGGRGVATLLERFGISTPTLYAILRRQKVARRKPKKHFITNLKPTLRLADCSVCGPNARVYKGGRDGAFHCATANDQAVRCQRRHLKFKRLALMHYSAGTMQCARCPYSDPRALSIDHVNNDGCRHRAAVNRAGSSLYQWLHSEGFPDGFQVLCMNCQFEKKWLVHHGAIKLIDYLAYFT